MTKMIPLALLFIGACGPTAPTSEIPAHCTPLNGGAVLACKGSFQLMKVEQRCPANMSACTALDPADLQACQKDLGGFFAAAVPAYHKSGDPDDRILCADPNPPDKYGLSGCGSRAATAPLRTYAAGQTCGGFPAGIFCFIGSGWNCPNSDIRQGSNTNEADGVLCCPDAP